MEIITYANGEKISLNINIQKMDCTIESDDTSLKFLRSALLAISGAARVFSFEIVKKIYNEVHCSEAYSLRNIENTHKLKFNHFLTLHSDTIGFNIYGQPENREFLEAALEDLKRNGVFVFRLLQN
jgi:hypothetical protein